MGCHHSQADYVRYCLSLNSRVIMQSESVKNFFKILYFSSVELNPFGFEHFYLFLYSSSRRLSLKSPNPTGCGNNPVSWDLRRIGVFSHGLPDAPICSGFQGMGNFFIGRYAPLRHFSQKIVRFIGKSCHFFIISLID